MPTLSFHTSNDALQRQIEQRTPEGHSRSETIETALDNYFLLLAGARKTLKRTLTGEELYLLCDLLNGTLFDAMTFRFGVDALRHELSDGVELNGIDKKWKVDAKALDKKLSHMTLTEMIALVDAVQSFWNKVSAGEEGSQTKSPLEMGILD